MAPAARNVLLDGVLGVLVFLAALCLAVALLYTRLAFSLLGLEALALDVVNGALASAELTSVAIGGKRFTAPEIAHLLEVKTLVAWTRGALVVLGAALAWAAWRSPRGLAPACAIALALYAALLAGLAGAYGILGYVWTSDFLHGLVFEPGSYIFARGTLTSDLYSQRDMMAGALFVAATTGCLLLISYLMARYRRAEN